MGVLAPGFWVPGVVIPGVLYLTGLCPWSLGQCGLWAVGISEVTYTKIIYSMDLRPVLWRTHGSIGVGKRCPGLGDE